MIQNVDACLLKKRCSVGALLLFAAVFSTVNLSGQVVLDGKFGSGSVSGPAFKITPDLGTIRGNNLFHSFQQFDLKAGDVATFSGPANIQNILSRVTGGSPSTINGKIRSQITGANFFLINPSGLIFGPNATVDVSGSFAVSSANYLKLADGAKFIAALDADDSALTTAPVSDFGFLNGNSGSITMQRSGIQGKAGATISVVGGDITMQGGFLRSAAGNINVASVKSAGETPVNPGDLTAAEFRTAFPTQGQIALTGDARIDASGEAGGRIVIRGGNLQMENSRIEANTLGATEGRGIDIAITGAVNLVSGGQINTLSPDGNGAAGNIAITADSIHMDGGGLTDDFFNPTTQISSATGIQFVGGGPARGGDISIKARNVELINSAQISAASNGLGDAGQIDIEASSVLLDAVLVTQAQITANAWGFDNGGNAGDIRIRTDTLDVLNGAAIVAASFGSGNAGKIDVEAGSINILRGGVFAAGTFGFSADAGNGGNIQVKAQSLRIDGQDKVGSGPDVRTGIQAVTTAKGSPAPGGNIQINVGSVSLDHAGSIFTSSSGPGKGGDIDVVANNLTIANGSTIRASGDAAGSAGKITVQTSGSVLITETSAITTSAPKSSGGDIIVAAGSEIRLVNSEINAQAGLDGGNITVSAPELIYLLNSKFTGQADTSESGFGNGGNLTIEQSEFLILNQSALISKSSFGNGGNITILADNFFQSASVIDASAPFGLPGAVKVTAPEIDLSGSLIGLPSSLLDAASQLQPDCGIRLTGNISSFIVLGRGGLPLQPGGFLPSGMVPTRDESK